MNCKQAEALVAAYADGEVGALRGYSIYRYREHTIDVFVLPYTSLVPTSAVRSMRGFNVARASGSTMDWLAVSDAELAVLSAFVQRLAREEVRE